MGEGRPESGDRRPESSESGPIQGNRSWEAGWLALFLDTPPAPPLEGSMENGKTGRSEVIESA